MKTYQREFILTHKKKGFHLITNEIINNIKDLELPEIGIMVLNLKHTSASICINECADPEVRVDMENFLHRLIPENLPYFEHTYEGADDMPAHIKSGIIGTSLTIPITNSKLNLGTWQGIYLGEHRNHGGSRRIIVTIMG